jgi:hypothetical protein
MTDVARCIPIMASLDLAETARFYTDTLHFAVLGVFDDYLIVRRDDMEIHYWLCHDPKLPQVTACYIRGGQVPALFAEFSRATFTGGKISDFAVRPWNMKEFYVYDPHGNLLKFGCAPEECGN